MKHFGHKRPKRNNQGEIMSLADCPARAVTHETCGPQFGADRSRKLIVSLEAGDLIVMRPQRTKRSYRIAAKDLFLHLLRCEANLLTLAKARDRKAKKQTRLALQRQARAEKRLFGK